MGKEEVDDSIKETGDVQSPFHDKSAWSCDSSHNRVLNCNGDNYVSERHDVSSSIFNDMVAPTYASITQTLLCL